MSKRTPTSGRAGRLSKLLDSASPTLSFSETDSGYENLDASNLSAYVPRPRTDSERVVARARFQTEDYEELREADAVRRQANIELEEAHTKHDKEMRELIDRSSVMSMPRTSLYANLKNEILAEEEVSTWSLTNPFHWSDRREHAVEKPRGHNHMGGYIGPDEKKAGGGKRGGILDDDAGGSGTTKVHGKVKKKVAKKDKSPAALTIADMMLPRNNFVRSSILKGMYDDSSSSSEDGDKDDDDDAEHDPLKEERRILAKKKKNLLAKYDRMIARSEKKLDNYHYSLAKAKLDKKLMIHEAVRKGAKGQESPIVKEALWNSRWGVGLRSNIPESDHNAGTKNSVVIKDGMHQVLIRRDSGRGGEDEDDGKEKTKRKPKQVDYDEVQKRAMDRMKMLRSTYNQVAHQLGVHNIDSVHNCKGAERVEMRKNQN